MLRKIKILCIISVMLLLTGCVKFNTTMDIKNDKSMDLSILYAVDTSVLGEEELLKEEDISEYKKAGFEVTDYSEGNYKGITLKKHVKNIDKISKTTGNVSFNIMGSSNNEDDSMFTVKKGFLRNVYTLKMESDSTNDMTNGIDVTDGRKALEGEDDTLLDDYPTDDTLLDDYSDDGYSFDDADYTQYLSQMDLSLTVNLPNKPISNNATSVSNNGKSLTWNLATQQEDVELTFALYNLSNLLICVVGVIVVVVVVVVIISKSGKNKNISNNQATNNEQNVNTNNSNEVNNMNNTSNEGNNMNNTSNEGNNMNNTSNEVQPMVENVNNEVQPVVESVNNDSINNSVSDVPSVEVAPTEAVNNVNEQDDIFPDNQPNTEQNEDSSPLEDLFNNNTNNN